MRYGPLLVRAKQDAYNLLMPVGERRLLESSELWPHEQELCKKAAEGTLLDLRCREPGENGPARGRDWGPQRGIRAQVLFQLLTGQGPQLADHVVAVRVQGAHIVGRLNLGGWKLRCPLELNQCHMRHRFDLAKTEIPNLNLRGSYLRSGFFARRLRVAHTLNVSAGFRCDGGAVLREAHIGGALDCSGATFRNPDGDALNADNLTVDADMLLHQVECTGEVRLLGARISGNFECDGATFSNSDGYALNAANLTVGADMYLRAKAQCTGEVRLLGARISGNFECGGATFSNPDGYALNADNLTVGARMFLHQAQFTGKVLLLGAHVTGQLDCSGATFSNRGGFAVDLQEVSVSQSVFMRPASLEGGLKLTGARVGAWLDEQRTWPTMQDPPAKLRLDNFIYDEIHGVDASESVDDRLGHWLPRNPYLPQPYEQLAGVYRREGHDKAARAVAIGKQRARRADIRGWPRWPSVAWSAVLRWTIGYGYRPVLALIPLAMLVLAGSLLFLFASQHPDQQHPLLRPTKPGSPEQPAFNSFRYTLDLLLPVVNFKQRDGFVAEGWAAWAAFGFTFAGWLLAAIVVAGLSGVFKRD